MTPAEAARRSRRAQGLPDRVTDPGALDALAALIAVTSASSAGPQSEKMRGQRESA